VASDVHGRRHLVVLGDLDLAGVQGVRDELLAEAASGRPILLDLTRLGFVASIGAALLLETVQAAGDLLEVVLPPAGPVRRPLDLAGLTDLLTAGGTDAGG
jgi:anti-anti-sigma factor